MNIKNLNTSAKKVHKALMEPANMLTKDLRKKLKGAYKSVTLEGWYCIRKVYRAYLSTQFPAGCFIRGKEEDRHIIITIKFNWSKWDKTIQGKKDAECLELNINDHKKNPRNHFKSIAFKTLDNPAFINEVKTWLKGEEIDWKKWAMKK